MTALTISQIRRKLSFKNIEVASFIEMTVVTLIGLLFFSKLSLKWTKIVPRSLAPLFFQYGMHPYINFGLNLLAFLTLLFYWKKRPHLRKTSQGKLS